MTDLETCAACGEQAFDGRRCKECGSMSLDALHDLVRQDIREMRTEPFSELKRTGTGGLAMSAPQFTPGPWYPHSPLGSQRKCGVTAGKPYDHSKGAVRRIAWLGSAGPTRGKALDAEDMANGNLIAAAPELYDALHDIVARLLVRFPAAMDAPDVQRAVAVLTKARGEA